MVEQNLALCMAFAALAGLAGTLATFSLLLTHGPTKEILSSFVSRRDVMLLPTNNASSQTSHKISHTRKFIGYAVSLFFQAANATLLTFAPMYGPVSLYRPTLLASKLLSNLVLVGGMLRRGDTKKDTRVATYLCVIAVVLLPIVGPTIQEDQHVEDLLLQPAAIAFSSFLALVFTISAVYMFTAMFTSKLKSKSQAVVQTCLLGVSVSSSILAGSIARAMSIATGTGRIALIASYVIVQICWCTEYLMEAKTVTSLTTFVPLFTVLDLIGTAASGLIIWEDWRVVSNWVGYACGFSMLVLGVYLMSDVDFLRPKHELPPLKKASRRLPNRSTFRKQETEETEEADELEVLFEEDSDLEQASSDLEVSLFSFPKPLHLDEESDDEEVPSFEVIHAYEEIPSCEEMPLSEEVPSSTDSSTSLSDPASEP